MVSIDYIWLPSLLEAFDLGSEDAFFLLEAIGGYAYIESNSVYSPWTVDYMPKVRNKIQQIKSNTEEEIAEIQWSCRKGNGNKMSTQDIMNYGQVLKTIELFKANGRKYIENIRYEVIINAFVKKGQVLSYLSAAGHIQQKKVKGLPLGFAPSSVEKETIPNEKTPIQPEDELKRLEAMEANNPTDFHNKLRAKELLVKSIDQNAQVSFEQVQAGLSHEQPAPSPDEHPPNPEEPSPLHAWEALSIRMVNREYIEVHLNGERTNVSCTELGLSDGRSKNTNPNRTWQLLELLAAKRGELENDEYPKNDSNRQIISSLRKTLQSKFPNIEGDPIISDQNGLRTVFSINMSSKLQAEMHEQYESAGVVGDDIGNIMMNSRL